jgi:choline dehydrogenase-like flavoprotein
MSLDRFDVIIIGTGAGGGTLLHELASTGKRILVLERGGFLPRERENWDARAVNAESRYQSRETWYDADDRPFSPYTHYWVGGNTKVYGAALLRNARARLRRGASLWGRVTGVATVLCGLRAVLHTRAERLYSVHGERGLDPHDPPTSAPYPHGPLAHEARMKEVFDDLTALGHRPFPVPIGLRLPERVGGAVRGPETRLSMFDGYPDPTETKADSHVSCVQPALERSNVTLLTNTMVERIVTTSSGREVTGVVAVHRGERVDVPGLDRGAGVRSDQQRGAASALVERCPSERVGQRIGHGRSKLHVPPQRAVHRGDGHAESVCVPEVLRHDGLLSRRR